MEDIPKHNDIGLDCFCSFYWSDTLYAIMKMEKKIGKKQPLEWKKMMFHCTILSKQGGEVVILEEIPCILKHEWKKNWYKIATIAYRRIDVSFYDFVPYKKTKMDKWPLLLLKR